MPEWPKGHAWKACVQQCTMGSNPILSAKGLHFLFSNDIFISMLDIVGIIYFTLSNLYLLGTFPVHIFEFLDLRTGYAVSDYALIFGTGTYFNISAIVTGLLCGLDAITNPKYKRVKKIYYNLHAISAFALIGVGIYPLTGNEMDINRVLHWVFAIIFILVYPLSRILILRSFSKKYFRKLLLLYLFLNLSALVVSIFTSLTYVAYPEYLMWLALLSTIVLSQIVISKKKRKANCPEVK